MCSVSPDSTARIEFALPGRDEEPELFLQELDLDSIDKTHDWKFFIEVEGLRIWACSRCGAQINKSWIELSSPDTEGRRYLVSSDRYEPHISCPEMVVYRVTRE